MNDVIHYHNGVTLTRKPDARGYFRVRTADGGDFRRRDPAAARRLADDLSQGRGPTVQAQSRRTVNDLVEHFLDPHTHDRKWSRSYREANEAICNAWVKPHLGSLHVSDWHARQTRRLLRKMEDAGLMASTRRSYLAVIRRVGFIGQRDEWIEHDPCAGVTVPKDDVTMAGTSGNYIDPATIPTPDAVDLFADALADHCGQPWRRLQVRLSAYSGMRASEMLALHGKHVSLDAGTIDVAWQLERESRELVPPKGRKRRKTIFPSFLDGELAVRLDQVGDGLLFPGFDGRAEPYPTFRTCRWRPAADACGWSDRFVWHDLRHFFCTWALTPQPEGLGLSVQDVSLFAGHHSPSFTFDRYVGVAGDPFARAREASNGHR